MTRVAVMVDIDWACEPAIEETLDFLRARGIPVTVFATHRSARVEAALSEIEVGLHPYFAEDSSHGRTIEDVVRAVVDLPHNVAAFRCHRFAVSNESNLAMAQAGMRICSNVCTDLEVVPPFVERSGLLEVPISLEDGTYLLRGHPLEYNDRLHAAFVASGTRVLVLHPMHFAVNTPHFGYMKEIKRSFSREAWNGMTRTTLDRIRWRGRGIRDLVSDLLDRGFETSTLGQIAQQRTSRA
jgi:hypothetical protein